MFGFLQKKQKAEDGIELLESLNKILTSTLDDLIDSRLFAERNYEEAICNRRLDLLKLQEILESNKHWTVKQLELKNYVRLALEYTSKKGPAQS